jgi:hypothetical protein
LIREQLGYPTHAQAVYDRCDRRTGANEDIGLLMRSRFEPSELACTELVPGLSFTKGAPVMRMPGWTMSSSAGFGTLLYDLQADPGQNTPRRDPALELRMADLLVRLMRESEAPPNRQIRYLACCWDSLRPMSHGMDAGSVPAC